MKKLKKRVKQKSYLKYNKNVFHAWRALCYNRTDPNSITLTVTEVPNSITLTVIEVPNSITLTVIKVLKYLDCSWR